MKRIASIMLAIVMLISVTSVGSIAFAEDYSAFPVYKEMPEDNMITAPTIKLNGSYNIEYKNGTYTDVDRTDLYSVSAGEKVLKFVPTETGYYESSISCSERNQHIYLKFTYSDASSIAENKYYTVSKGDHEYYIHTSKEESLADYDYYVFRNTARAGAYLEKGKTYYIICTLYYDDYEIENLLKTEVQGYSYHTVPATVKVYKHSHDYDVETTKYSDYTWAYYNCVVCGYSKSSSFYKPTTLSLSTTTYTYDGKEKKPSVTVKDSYGNKISASNYTVTYSSGRKNVGKYTVKVKFKNEYARFGTLSKTFIINPKGTSISSLAALSKGFTAKWKKQSTQTTGYQIRYSTSSSMSSAKNVTVSKNSTVSKKVTKLKAKKKYYVQVRTYKTVNGAKYYSSWSAKKAVTTKK